MPKKLILCLDGTSNQFCRDNTNVVKIAALLDKNAADQMLYYQPGIGTIPPPTVFSRTLKWVLTRLDLAFAILLKHHVQDAYRFLMRHYAPEDEIYVFGFSRGAYTARVLAGMVCKVGLLQKGNEELVPFAWELYARSKNDGEAREFRNTFSRRVRIAFLGLWDTVSSVRYAWKDRSFPYTFDNPIVSKIRHAIALDERRAYFRTNLWKEPPSSPNQDIKQVWFPGVHCDVGGGYREAESGLSKIALEWMIDEVGTALRFHPKACDKMLPRQSTERFAAPDPAAPLHESLRGWWRIAELIPKRTMVKDERGRYVARWTLPRGRPRHVPQGALLHESISARMRAVPTYQPPNLPGYPPDVSSGAVAEVG